MSKKNKLPVGNYRAVEGDHVLTAVEYDPANKRLAARWSGKMCDLCFQRGTVLVKGRVYCADHVPGGAA